MGRSFIICIVLSGILFSAEDSTRIFPMNDVVITGTRAAVDVVHLPSAVRILDSADLMRANGATLSEKIRHTAGVSMRMYGGAGSLQSVSFRGLGSDYSLILIDGQRFTTSQISTVDLGIFLMNEVERIEIAPGGNSSHYGSDAVGGLINIVTQRPDGRSFLTVSQTIGSYGLTGTTLSAGAGIASASVRGSLSILRASNDFEFLYDDGISKHILRRAGSDFLMKNGTFSAHFVITDDLTTRAVFRYSTADRGQPSAVTGYVQSDNARINDRDRWLNSVTELELLEHLRLSLPITVHSNSQSYVDPSVTVQGQSLTARYENTSIGTTPMIRASFSPEHHIAAGAEVMISSIESNELFSSRREQYSGFISSEHHFPFLSDMILFPSVRYDSFNDVRGDLSPKLGINIGLWDVPVVRFRASYGKNYRVPTFNDLYWIHGGNPKLTPERSVNVDAGMTASVRSGGIDAVLELNYFTIDAVNKIVWQPVSGNVWTPVNLQSVSSSGFEGTFRANLWEDRCRIDFSHHILRTKKVSEDFPGDASKDRFLPYVPKEYSSFSVGSSWESLTVDLTYSFTGFRFETSDNNPRFFIPAFDNIDANISYGLMVNGISIRLRAEVQNLTDQEQSMFRGYPLPLRNYRCTTILSL